MIIKKLKCNKGIFGLFRRTPKPNLTPDVSQPKQEQLAFTRPLRMLATQGIEAATTGQDRPGIGFGNDFVSRATNPVIANRLDRLRTQEIPELEAAQGARGISRSSIATEQIRRTSRQAQGDIDQLLSNFFVLNEQQKKSDITDRVNLGVGLQNQQAQLLSQEAAASERLANATANQQFARNEAESQRLNQIGAVGASFLSPFISGGGISQGLISALNNVSGDSNSSNDELLRSLANAILTQT